MAATQRLELRQSQTLVMTPQLQQAIKLLQLSSLDLAAFVETELEENPLLARADDSPEAADPREAAEEVLAYGPEGGEAADSLEHALSEALPAAAEGPLDAQVDYDDNSPADDWGLSGPAGGSGAGGGFDGDGEDFEQRLSRAPTLREHLLQQLQVELSDPGERLLGAQLIEALEEDGYLRADLEELAEQLGCPRARLEALLARLQRFEPTGVFARDLRECLALQLAERDRLDPCMAALLDNLPLVAARDWERLQRLCSVDREDLIEMVAELRALDPRPAAGFGEEAVQAVVPDVLLRTRPDGGWMIELNPDSLPRVLVDSRTYARVVGGCRDLREREYLAERLQSANWLVRSLHQRATTILKVAEEIVRQQDGFFRHGVAHLRPLTLREVAEAIGMHESTVSRVTANKYLAAPRGTFELKYFFTTAIAGTSGGEHSAEAVRHRIRALIEGESADAVLSDDAIVAQLRSEGVDIARRTVAKYREAMQIPSSLQRRRGRAFAP